jgi:hypothetical protein
MKMIRSAVMRTAKWKWRSGERKKSQAWEQLSEKFHRFGRAPHPVPLPAWRGEGVHRTGEGFVVHIPKIAGGGGFQVLTTMRKVPARTLAGV